jgi:hypothetical protein
MKVYYTGSTASTIEEEGWSDSDRYEEARALFWVVDYIHTRPIKREAQPGDRHQGANYVLESAFASDRTGELLDWLNAPMRAEREGGRGGVQRSRVPEPDGGIAAEMRAGGRRMGEAHTSDDTGAHKTAQQDAGAGTGSPHNDRRAGESKADLETAS